VVMFIPILVIHALKDKENQVHNFSILIFVLSFMAINIMAIALRVSKNVLHSMTVAAKENLMTSSMVESANTFFLHTANMDSTLTQDQLDKANLIHEKTAELNDFLQELMVDILLATDEDNRMAVASNGSIDLSKAKDFDVHKSTERVIFGTQFEIGKEGELLKSIETYRELLLAHAGSKLDGVINEMLDTNSSNPEEMSWTVETFAQTPMIAAIISLSNLQFDIHFLEGEVLKEIL
jgi:hypothetical protein